MTSSIPPPHSVVGGSLRPGHRVFKYEIRELLEPGPRGSVYRGFDTFLLRPVRIVLVPLLGRRGSLERDAMQRTLRDLSQFRDPRLTPVLDAGEYGERYVSIVLAEQREEALATRVARQGPLPRETALRVACELAEVLDVVHSAGLAHGKLTAKHVVLSADGSIVLDGLGVASWGEAVTIEDDLRGLGELLSWMLPGSARLESDANVVRRLLDPLPRGRFSSMREVVAVLNECRAEVPPSQVVTDVDLPTVLDLEIPGLFESPASRATHLGLGPETKGIEGLPTRTADVELPMVLPGPSVRPGVTPVVGAAPRANSPAESDRESLRGLVWLIVGATCLGAAVGVAIATHGLTRPAPVERSLEDSAALAPSASVPVGLASAEVPPPAEKSLSVIPISITPDASAPLELSTSRSAPVSRRPRSTTASAPPSARPPVLATELPEPWSNMATSKRK